MGEYRGKEHEKTEERSHRDRDPKERHYHSHHRERSRERRRYSERPITQDELNELNARILRNKMRGSTDIERLEKRYAEYTERLKRQQSQPHFKREFATISTTEDDLTIEEMLKEERLTTGMERSAISAITKDRKYSNDLDYQEENSSKLSKYVQRGDIDLKNMATSQAQQLARALDRCQLCIENDHCAEILSMGESVYLTLAPQPELAPYVTMIVPINHHANTLHCGEDEWEEIRHYMIALSQFYYSTFNKSVVFYETAVNKNTHAAIVCVPIPMSLSSAIQGYFKMAMLEEADDFEQQHNPIINTLEKSNVLGPDSFRHSLAKEAPYFHVWFTLNGGLGHIVEETDTHRWPHGDLFARQVLGGALKVDPYIIRRQGRWERNDERVNKFSKLWSPYDWTEKLHQ
jgi:hypothetical protein